MDNGGMELACMSTSTSKEVAINYSGSNCPIIFTYKTSGMSRGCSLRFLSVYPKDEEYLYPPLTYLQPEIIYKEDGLKIVEVIPQMA